MSDFEILRRLRQKDDQQLREKFSSRHLREVSAYISRDGISAPHALSHIFSEFFALNKSQDLPETLIASPGAVSNALSGISESIALIYEIQKENLSASQDSTAGSAAWLQLKDRYAATISEEVREILDLENLPSGYAEKVTEGVLISMAAKLYKTPENALWLQYSDGKITIEKKHWKDYIEEQILFCRFIHDDPAAVRIMMKKIRKSVEKAFSNYKVPDSEHVEQDIIAEVLRRIYENFRVKKASLTARLSTYLFSVIRNVISEQTGYINKHTSLAEEERAEEEPDEDLSVFEKIFDLCKEKIEGKDRSLLNLFYLEGRSYIEIGRIMDITPGNVGTRLERTRKRLRILACIEAKKLYIELAICNGN